MGVCILSDHKGCLSAYDSTQSLFSCMRLLCRYFLLVIALSFQRNIIIDLWEAREEIDFALV